VWILLLWANLCKTVPGVVRINSEYGMRKKKIRPVKIGKADRNVAEIYRALEDFWKSSCEWPIINNKGSKQSSFEKCFCFFFFFPQRLRILINFFMWSSA